MVFVNFPRVDLEIYHGDAGFSSFLSMLRADHEFNSPVVSRALFWVLVEARRNRLMAPSLSTNDTNDDKKLLSSISSVNDNMGDDMPLRKLTHPPAVTSTPIATSSSDTEKKQHHDGYVANSDDGSMIVSTDTRATPIVGGTNISESNSPTNDSLSSPPSVVNAMPTIASPPIIISPSSSQHTQVSPSTTTHISAECARQRLRVMYALLTNPVLLHNEGLRK
jgi:hypothetical protein